MSTAQAQASEQTVETNIPARLDRLPWSRWHWMIVFGLGTVWILDGLEVNFLGMISARLSEPGSGLTLSTSQGIAAGAVYVFGACVGALFFGHLTDRFGRRKLFLITLALYLVATILTGLSFSVAWFYAMRFLTGAGIGGEYAAINSAIDELIPARVRGTIDLWINGSFWLGTVLAGAIALVLLDKSLFPINVGWRLGFGIGALLGLGIMFIRSRVPESPRWLVIHGRDQEAEEVVGAIEHDVLATIDDKELPEPDPDATIRIHQRKSISFRKIASTILTSYPRRTIVCLALFAGQAFLYNAVVFAQADTLTTFFKVSAEHAPIYIIPFAVGNFLGYNTLTQAKEPLQTVAPGRVGMYVCGPTVYSNSHVGHMVGPVIFDTIKRYLVYSGYDVTWVVNITDVDDKLINRVRDEGATSTACECPASSLSSTSR